MKDIIINVSGLPNSGKSRLIYLIKEFLKERQFNVDFDGGTNFQDEEQFDTVVGNNIDPVIDSLKESRKITIIESNINRDLIGLFNMN
jgi:uridine kinase